MRKRRKEEEERELTFVFKMSQRQKHNSVCCGQVIGT
jgi:hypothetical protein